MQIHLTHIRSMSVTVSINSIAESTISMDWTVLICIIVVCCLYEFAFSNYHDIECSTKHTIIICIMQMSKLYLTIKGEKNNGDKLYPRVSICVKHQSFW